MRKMLTFSKDGEQIRILWSDGICKTPAALEKVMNGGWAWDDIKTSGNTTPKPPLKFVAKKPSADDPRFLGLQNPPKAQPKPVEKDEDGTEKPRRGRKPSNITPELVEKMKALAPTMTLKQAEQELGISYANLHNAAKKHGVEFVKGKRGKPKKVLDKPAEV